MADAQQKPSKPWYKRWWAIALGIFLAIGIIGAATSPAPKDDSSDSSSQSSQDSSNDQTASDPPEESAPEKPKAPADCGTKATEDCTPHVASDGSVRVDALVWRIRSAKTASALGDQQYGLGAKANGRFIVLKVKVHSEKNESATLSDNSIKLEVNGNTYDADSDGTIAAIGAGEQPFFLDTIGPDSDRNGVVVFDVPEKVLSQKIEIRFNELGFGETHGYIRLPSLSST